MFVSVQEWCYHTPKKNVCLIYYRVLMSVGLFLYLKDRWVTFMLLWNIHKVCDVLWIERMWSAQKFWFVYFAFWVIFFCFDEGRVQWYYRPMTYAGVLWGLMKRRQNYLQYILICSDLIAWAFKYKNSNKQRYF